MNKKFAAFIFARGGSKGVKNKNVVPIAGKPLLAYSIETAKACDLIERVIVSTDDPQIAATAIKYGAKVLNRPLELAQDDTPEIQAWRHAILHHSELFNSSMPQPFISLPATSPLRSVSDIEAGIKRFNNGDVDIVFSITPSHRNPYLNMVTVNQQNHLQIAIPGSNAARRQDVPEVFDVGTSVYVANAQYILSSQKLMDGKVGYIIVPRERSLDIDNHYDLHLAECLIANPFRA